MDNPAHDMEEAVDPLHLRTASSKANRFILVSLLTVLISCDVNLVPDYRVADSYFVAAIDFAENRSLYYDLGGGDGVGRVNRGVTAVGWNESHIIVEQHKDNQVLFYILETEKDHKYADPDESVLGPFSEEEFREARARLKVDPNLAFTKRFGFWGW